MNSTDLSPAEAWDAAEEQIDVWQEDKEAQRRKMWRLMNGY